MKKIAIIGTAHIHAKKILQTLKQRKDLEVIALWDPNPNRRERDANILETTAISNYNEILGNKGEEVPCDISKFIFKVHTILTIIQ